jgi:protein tyrosine phosphatase (PTP) superfamily phosphohydrolase (DUF442 family)
MLWKKKKSNIGRYTRLESWLGRGGQPTKDGYKMLAHYGFKTIVNLRRSEEHVPKELAGTFNLVHIPVKNHGTPKIEQVLQWLELCANPANHPIFVHCQKGEGRTSTFLGLVRIAQGYPIDEIINEGIYVYDFPESEHGQIAFLRDFSRMVQCGEVEIPRLMSEAKNSAILTVAAASGG